MAVFQHCSVLLEMKTLPFKEKKKLKSAVTENGGRICYIVDKQCSLVVTSDVSELSCSRLRGIQRHQTAVVGPDYVFGCLESGLLLPVDDYRLHASSPAASSPPLPDASITRQEFKAAAAEPPKGPAEPVDSVGPSPKVKKGGAAHEEFRVYSAADSDLPTYPENFQVAKYSIFEKMDSWCVLELQSCRAATGRQYRVVQHWKDNTATQPAAARDTLVFLSTSEEALQVYEAQRETLQAAGLQPRTSTPPQNQHLGSAPLQQLLLEEKLNTGSLSQEVGVFVELLWTEAMGRLGNVLRVPIDRLSLNDVSRVEGLLLEAQRKLKEANHAEVASLLGEVYTLLPHMEPLRHAATAKLLSQKLDLCQLIRDVLNVSETTLRSSAPSSLGKYRALRCGIEAVKPDTPEFQAVTALLHDRTVQVRRVLRVGRGAELQTFRSEVGNVKPLLHSSSPSNFVGVLSRGLLLPRVGVEHHGIERTDVGHLGSGIYFSDAVSTSLKYSVPSETDGSRLLLVCDVALGRCRDVRQRDATLTQAPEGHHSVHGVRHQRNAPSQFEDDEYVVYAADQVKLKYVVQFSIAGEQVKEFSPAVDTAAEAPPTSDRGRDLAQEDDEVESIKNPLADVKAGLMDSAGQQLPLQAVHVKCKLMDLLSQVVIFQTYSNVSSAPIEAKYVFPLDESAAVCGFEAFINGKHVVGQVKEKEAARREYKQAIEKGHGAYLMDQDAPDVFTISVGNLPPGATVLIKVTFVSELVVRDGSVLFSLPGSVAPWQESAALNQTTQVSVEKVCVTDEAREFSLDVSVEMPNKITDLQCITHRVKTKRTDCKAVVSVLPGEVMGQDGFQLSITLSDVHLPRMWVEQHPDKDSQAAMLVFYPDFEVDSASAPDEVVLLVDTSESMKGEPLRAARAVARHVLRTLDHNLRLNVIFFGTDHADAFLTARPLAEARPAAESFIKRSAPVGGSTELWRPLRALSLLPPSRGVRNLLLLSDGHVQNAELALRLLRDNAQHSRLFTCGLSPTANRHMLRALAQAGGGAYEYFDTKTKHNWAEKVACQLKRMASPGCSSVSVKWQQFDPTAPPAVQAPKQLHALFNDCHALVYGFVPHCTQATLLGNLSGQELKTMVSTSELQKTKGTFLHKLTARAVIRDYEDGSLDSDEAEHECKKKELKRFVIELSKEFSILSRFTSFVAVEERDSEQTEEGFTDIPKLISEEDVDFLPYISWISPQDSEEEEPMDMLLDMDLECCMEEEDDDYEEEESYEEAECAEAISHRELSGYQPSSLMMSRVKTLNRWTSNQKEEEVDDDDVLIGGKDEDEESSEEDDDDDDEESSEGEEDEWAKLAEGDGISLDSCIPLKEAECAEAISHRELSGYQPSSLMMSRVKTLNRWTSNQKEEEDDDDDVLIGGKSPSMVASSTLLPPPPRPRPRFQVSQGQPQRSTFSAHRPHPPPPPPPAQLPVSQGQPQRSTFSILSAHHPPPPPSAQFPVSEGLSQSSALSGYPPPPRPGGPPFVRDSPTLCRRLYGSAAIPTLHDSMGDMETDQSEMTYRSRRSRAMGMESKEKMSMDFMEEHETLKGSLCGAVFSDSHRAVSLLPTSSDSAPTGGIVRSQGSLRQQPQQNLMSHSMQFGKNPEAESKQAPATGFAATPAGLSSGFGFGGSRIQANSVSRRLVGALQPTQSSRQPAEDLFDRSVLNENVRMLIMIDPMSQSQPVEQDRRAELVQAHATPPGRRSGFRFGGSRIQDQFLSQRLGDALETTHSRCQPAEDLSDRFVIKAKDQMFQSQMVEQDRRAELEQAPVPPAALSSGYSFGGFRIQTNSVSRRPGDALEPTQSARQPVEDLSDPFVLNEKPRMSKKKKTFQSQPFGQDRRAESEQAPATPPGLSSGFSFGGSRIQTNSVSRRSGDALEPTQSARQPAEDLYECSVMGGTSNQRDSPVWNAEGLREKNKSMKRFHRPSLIVHQQAQQTAALSEALRLRWTKIFQMQHSEGYWELTTELGELIDFNVDLFANGFLKNKGIQSLGVRAHTDILRLVATLLVLQLMRVLCLKEGELLRTLFSLDDSSLHRPARWEELKRAVDWVCWADRQYPCVCSRLEFGLSWETSTRQLLGFQSLPPLSALTGLKLQRSDHRLLLF